MPDVFGYKRPVARSTGLWDATQVRNVRIKLRDVNYGGIVRTGPIYDHIGIASLQFHDAYVAVIMPDTSAFIYPHVTVAQIQTLPTQDASPEARLEAVALYKQLTAEGLIDGQPYIPAPAGAAESGNASDSDPRDPA